jgi:phosphoadenosine phosphosulfate reductase
MNLIGFVLYCRQPEGSVAAKPDHIGRDSSGHSGHDMVQQAMMQPLSSTIEARTDAERTPSAAVPTPVRMRRSAQIGAAEMRRINSALEGVGPAEIVRWAHGRFGGRLKMTASFADTTLIDIATGVAPDIEVVFLDTGFHFAETLNTVRRAMERYALNLTVLRPAADAADVWEHGSDACCAARKIDPLADYLPRHADAWLSGLRRADSTERADAPIVSIDARGLVKVNPMANMSDDEYAAYIVEHDVIVNTLAYDGYASIGCWPCTEPSADRSGRWGGAKSECGLHL